MSKERGTSPEYPDIPPLYPSYYPRYAGRLPPEHWGPRHSDEDVQERRPDLWTRLKAWFARPAPKRDSYVSNVVNPDDRRFIPRR